jgi:uncharacterized membrane protein YfcA
MNVDLILTYLALGAFVGLVAGLLGIGGGGVLVPMLTAIFLSQNIPVEQVVHLALGSSMPCIMVTSLSSLRAHHANGAVVWPLVKLMVVGVVFGTFSATFIASMISSKILAIFFACFMAYVAIQMFSRSRPANQKSHQVITHHEINRIELMLTSIGIGSISAMVSIGGGSITVPYLTWRKIDIRKAIGTSAAIGFPLSIAGSLGYLLSGWAHTPSIPYTYGFINLPAVLVISITSFFAAPIGANLTQKLPVGTLKKIFALLLAVLSLKMLWNLQLLPCCNF